MLDSGSPSRLRELITWLIPAVDVSIAPVDAAVTVTVAVCPFTGSVTSMFRLDPISTITSVTVMAAKPDAVASIR